METAYIGLGSNVGNGMQTLQQAWNVIGTVAGVRLLALSSPYLSAPVGMASSNWFTNAVGKLQTGLAAIDLLHTLLAVEHRFGRRRDEQAEGYQDRTLDLDILYYGGQVIHQAELTVPHPQRDGRLFVLQPLVELAGDMRDPQDGLTLAEKLSALHQHMEDGSIDCQEIRRAEWPSLL